MTDNKEMLKDKLKKFIHENPEKFPFISEFLEFEFSETQDSESDIEYGYFQTRSNTLLPFYKPYSKIIELTKI